MKEVLGSLPEVITAYKNYNLLVPTATDVQLNPFYKFHVEEVPVDLGENSGDIFKVGSVKTGKPCYCPRCNHVLNAGPNFQPKYCSECGQNPGMYAISCGGIESNKQRIGDLGNMG